MNKNEFINVLSFQMKLPKKECKIFLEKEFEVLCSLLKTGNSVDLKNFGKIYVKTKKEHFCKIKDKIYLINQKNEPTIKLYKNFKSIVK